MTVRIDEESDRVESSDTLTANDEELAAPGEDTSMSSEDGQPTTGHPEDQSSAPPLNEDDDDVTVIFLDAQTDDAQYSGMSFDWIQQQGPEMEQRRRSVLLREINRMQRSSFLHFVLLCSVPVILLIVVLVTVITDNEECASDATYCELEPRTFVNAFTTRCVCSPIPVSRNDEYP